MMISTMITIAFTVVFLLSSLFFCKGVKPDTRALTMTGLACALTLVLAMFYIPLPTGAAITCGSMLPLMVLALVYDYRLAIIGGWVCGILAAFLLPGWQIVHWGQFFVEHMVCFASLGYAGLFGKESRVRILCGGMLATVLKMFAHILSGVLFFSQNAWDGWGAWGYSFTYHLSSKVPEGILSATILMLLPLTAFQKAIKGGQRK